MRFIVVSRTVAN